MSVGEYAKSIYSYMLNALKAYTETTAILEWFYLYKVVSEYAKSILVYTENTLKASIHIYCKRISIYTKNIFSVNGEYAERHKTKN
jgi:hypothetical protein